MSRPNKQFIGICILILGLFILGGCSVDDPVANESMGKEIYAPVEIPYLIENPLEITSLDENENENNHRSYFQISGLKDKAVEDSINEAIKSLYEEMLPYVTGEKIAPFRGMKSISNSDRKIEHSHLLVYPQFNCNNVLSVVAQASGSYNHMGQHTYFSIADSLNFDLNTGKEFLLQDVFANDVKGNEIVNDAIVNELGRRILLTGFEYDEYNSLTLVAPFKGISQDQKFYLSNEGVNVIIDYNNPEFDAGFTNTHVTVPFYSSNGYIAITERFNDEENIFSEEPFAKQFLQDYHMNRVHEREFLNKNGIEWHTSTGRPENLQQNFLEIMDALRVEQEEKVTLLSQEPPVTFVEQNIYVFRIGSFVNISSNMYIGSINNSQWLDKRYVYSKTGEPILLEDLFVEGFDYITLIKENIDRIIRDHNLAQRFDANTEVVLEAVLEGLSFNLYDRNISFVTIPYEWDTDTKYPLHFAIDYEEIGFENLKIFSY